MRWSRRSRRSVPNRPLRDGVRVGRADGRQDGRDADAGGARDEVAPEASGPAPEIRKRGWWPQAVVSMSCCQSQAAVGWRGTFQCWMRRRSWLITTATENVRNVTALHAEEIGRPDVGGMVAEERAPAL